MKKTSLLYTAACLLSSMTLCLSGCGDDDPIIETPPVENPKPEPKPEPGPEKSMIDMYMLQFGYENEYINVRAILWLSMIYWKNVSHSCKTP